MPLFSKQSAWLAKLQPASFRGLKFAVMDSEIRRGRRTVVHEYPNRDIVWVEDLGRGTRRYGFRGFIVGDDCYDREKALIAAAEKAGPAELIHPSLGSIFATLVEFSSGQKREMGRVVELQLGFIEGAPAQAFPTSTKSTQGVVASAVKDANAAAKGDFVDATKSAFSVGIASVRQAVGTVGQIVGTGLAIVNDAGRLVHSVQGLGALIPSGAGVSLGRYSSGNIGPLAVLGPLGTVLASASAIVSTTARVEAGAMIATSNAITLGTAVQNAGASVIQLAKDL